MRFIFLSILLFATAIPGFSQEKELNSYGLWVTSKPAVLQQMVAVNPQNAMVDLRKLIPGIIIDLRYCGKDNFLQQPIYPYTRTTYLRKPAVAALARAQTALNEQGLALKVWDAYRPYSATVKMWEPVQDARYAADPQFGSGHNRGIAVDLTLVKLATGQELNMGTGFDNFSDTAHIDFKNLPKDVLANRQLLQLIMEQNGFKVLDTEWWHFYLPDAKKYELLDLSFRQLQQLSRKQVN